MNGHQGLTSGDCWHCSLLSVQSFHLSATNMLQFSGYILPGVIFLILGLRWACHCLWDWSKKGLARDYERAALPVPSPNYQLCPASAYTLPWEGIIKLILTGLGIVISVVLGGTPHQNRMEDYVGNIRHATIYLFFALSGLTDILVYYCGYSILPEGIQSFILSVAFAIEGLIFSMRLRFESYLEQQIHILLVVDIFACAFTSALEVLYDNKLIKFCRTYLCLVQGTWLIHGGFIVNGEDNTSTGASYPEALEWVSIIFGWHVAGNFILFVGSLLLIRAASKTDLFENFCCSFSLKMDQSSLDTTLRTTPTMVISSSTSSSTSKSDTKFIPNKLSTNHHNATLRALPSLPQPRVHQHSHHQHYRPEVVYPTQRIDPPSASPPMIVEAIPKDNIGVSYDEDNSLEEPYNTLAKSPDLRSSIKLKESSLI
ncbi:transmembrane protein 45B [Lepeophtheirus salmonis]|uniref:transmembrane protein 45B n=1 Tax=Lepeophtheirus salmonis TaxID=72036 RepID=UPI001AEA0ED1|nr:transmembrane protein 45B-like [Lepeophtheirus salmonis]XP_040575588.1 transmembrane protein 45B-like [Lepeophtheirus salmonis]